MTGTLYLASSSPRRRELLDKMGISYTIRVSCADEHTNAAAQDAVGILARRKACAAAQGLDDGIVLGADTLVSLNGKAMGKPGSVPEAKEMLRSLSGTVHQVYTGICLYHVRSGSCHVKVDRTDVWFRTVTEDEIDAYIATGEPMDKAGAYAIQGGAGKFVERIDGSFENVMGLPIQMLEQMLKETED